jgi:hypothetical protein
MSDVQHEAYRPLIEDGRGIFPADFRVKAPKGFNDAVRAAAQRQHMTRAEYARRALLRSIEADGVNFGAVSLSLPRTTRRNAISERLHHDHRAHC